MATRWRRSELGSGSERRGRSNLRDALPLASHPASIACADIPDGRGVFVEVSRVGVDGTDKEINDAEYGDALEGYDFLVTGHESFGRVLEVGSNVQGIQPGDYAVATVR